MTITPSQAMAYWPAWMIAVDSRAGGDHGNGAASAA
jgi:hypothetical protein